MLIRFYYYKLELGGLGAKYEEPIKYYTEESPEINQSKPYVIVFWINVFK